MKLSRAAWEYLNDPASNLRTDSSRKAYEMVLNRAIAQFDDVDLNDVDPDGLVTFCHGDGLAPNTVKQRKAILVAFYRWAGFRDLLTGPDPARKLPLGVRPQAKGVRRHNWLTAEQVHTLLTACPDTLLGQRMRVVIVLGVGCGLRRAEISGLRWHDVDFDQGTLTVVGKGEKLATLGLPDFVAGELKLWRAHTGGTAGDPVVCRLSSGLVGGGGYATVPSPAESTHVNTIHRDVVQAGKLAGIPGLRPHDLRRTYAGLLKAGGAALEEVQEQLRHSNVGTTQRYLSNDPRAVIVRGKQFKI